MRLLAILFLLFAVATPARSDNKAVAREAYREGTRQYDLGDYRLALDAFKRAYLAYEDPALLFNIAQCNRQLGDRAEAVKLYKSYLRKLPEAPNRGEVERLIAMLEAQLASERAPAPPTEVLPPTEPAPPPPPLPRPTVAPTELVATAPLDRGRPLRVGGAALLGAGGGLVALGAVFVGLAASANGDIKGAGGVYDPSAEDRRNSFQAADIAFFAVGGAALASGLTLYLVGRRAKGSH